jgi:beta-mannosidase
MRNDVNFDLFTCSLRNFKIFYSRDVENASVFRTLNFDSDESGEYTAELNMTISKKHVKKWWPNGFGAQALYDLQVQWEDARVNEVNNRYRNFFTASKTIKIGFRTIEVVQEQMANGLSFYFKVNDVPIFMKGSNWIPAHILPEKGYEPGKIKELLRGTRDANMNMVNIEKIHELKL